MKKILIALLVIGTPITVYNLATIFSIIGEDGWGPQQVYLILLLFFQLGLLALVGAGLGALVERALKSRQRDHDKTTSAESAS